MAVAGYVLCSTQAMTRQNCKSMPVANDPQLMLTFKS